MSKVLVKFPSEIVAPWLGNLASSSRRFACRGRNTKTGIFTWRRNRATVTARGGERGGIESGETENPRAPVTNVKCRHQSNYRFLSGGNEGTTTTTTSTRVEKKGERIDEEGVSSTGGSVGGRSNFKCKVLFESGFPLFCRGLRFKNCVGKYFLQWIIGNYRVVGKIPPRWLFDATRVYLERGRYSRTIRLLMFKAINSIINNIGRKDRENEFLFSSVIHQR